MADITNNPQSYGGFDYSVGETLLDYGRGVGAQFVAQFFKVYRVGNSSNGDVIQPANLIYSAFPALRKKPKDMLLETGRGPTYWYDLQADLSQIQVGDVCVLNDNVYGAGATSVSFATTMFVGFAIATHPVLERNVGARLDRNIRIYRVNDLAQPDGYLNQTFDGALPIRCVNGTWTVGTTGQTPSKCPAGFMVDRKMRGAAVPGLPDQTPNTLWSVYVPALKGFQFLETDWIVTDDGARYRVVNPYLQESGASGSQLIVEREVSP